MNRAGRVDSWFDDIADGMGLRDHDYVLTFSAYFDESQNGDILCVAGYVFEKRNAKKLERKWAKMLAQYELPYFRMSACNAGRKPFERLTEKQRIAAQTKAISLIKEHAEFGTAVSIDCSQADQLLRAEECPAYLRPFALGPYELGVYLCMMSVRLALEKAKPGEKYRVGYFFEDGHAHRAKAAKLIAEILEVPSLKRRYCWFAGGFTSKEAGGPIQAADVLAWQWCKDRVRFKERPDRPQRRDCAALLEAPVRVLHIDAGEHADWLRDTIRREALTLVSAQPF